MIFRARCQAVNVLLVAFWETVFFALQFCGPSKIGQEFGLVIDGDEFCVILGERVGRLNLDTVLRNVWNSLRNLREMSSRAHSRDYNITSNRRLRRW